MATPTFLPIFTRHHKGRPGRHNKQYPSKLEALLALQVRVQKLPAPETEYRFHTIRKWRFDFAWPLIKLAVEVEGGTYSKSRHTNGAGFNEDCQKYNAATLNGWQVLRFDSLMIKSGEAIGVITQCFRGLKHG